MEVSPEQGSTWPDDFRCPISLEVMTDPVILPSGHTFERRSIQRWLDGGHLTCPVTNLPLPPSPPLIPNHALRRLIAAVSPVAAAAVHNGGGGRLARSGPEGRRQVMESGDVGVLLRHAAGGDEVAARALLHLSLDGDDARDPRVVAVLVGVAGSGNARAIEQALVVLNLICGESNQLAREAIKLGAFHLCEALVNDDNCKIAKNAVELARTLEKL
ncbi:hypothetical protein OsJ_25989 [Oryza sativa Japonica Group]|uniref:U-box domain-containing protein n=1 Tax=Oryza sativa subsp. japonica TaxID=39947 RepID=B9FZ01_ORYSJ|nr:hypothetical protein OsJ_25989 [Oryza sativa Japonica Group]